MLKFDFVYSISNINRRFKGYHMKVIWDVTNKCNLKCKHCGESSLLKDKNKEFNWKTYMDYISGFAHTISLLGGEPLLHENILDIIEYANDKNIKVQMITNGQVSNNLLLNLMKFEIEDILISIDGLKQSHDKVRGNGTWEKAINSLEYLVSMNNDKKHKARIGINLVINKYNYDEIIDLIELTKRLDIIYQINPLSITGNAKNNENILSITDEQLIDIYEKIALYHSSNKNIKIILQTAYPIINDYLNRKYCTSYGIEKVSCGALTESIYADPYGNLMPCKVYKKEKIELSKSFDWKNDFNKFNKFLELTYNAKEPVCTLCKYSELCKLCPLEHNSQQPHICQVTVSRFNNLDVPLDSLFVINKPYAIIKSGNIYNVHYPNLQVITQYTIEGIKILEEIKESKSLRDISKNINMEPEIVYEFLLQEKLLNKVSECRMINSERQRDEKIIL